jgi:hypothetical protein
MPEHGKIVNRVMVQSTSGFRSPDNDGGKGNGAMSARGGLIGLVLLTVLILFLP